MDAITPHRPLFTRLGGGTSAASFCDEVKSILTGQNGDPQEFQKAVEKLQKVDPPEDISSDWKTVMDAWDAKDASEVDLQETQKAGAQVQRFIRDECGVSGQGEN